MGQATSAPVTPAPTVAPTVAPVAPVVAGFASAVTKPVRLNPNGVNVEVKGYPWACLLRITSPDGSASTASGFLVGPQTVVTAGHVVDGLKSTSGIRVFFESQAATKFKTGQEMPVWKVESLAYALTPDFQSDWAVLKLATPVTGVALPRVVGLKGEKMPELVVGKTFVAILGYGGTELQKGMHDRHMAIGWYGGTKGNVALLRANRDSYMRQCPGDSGGPVFVNTNRAPQPPGNPLIIGLVSHGYTNARRDCLPVPEPDGFFLMDRVPAAALAHEPPPTVKGKPAWTVVR